MKTALQKTLAKIAPSISIQTIWEHDPDAGLLEFEHAGMLDDGATVPEDWQAWQSEVRASAIINGEEISASGRMCGTWEKAEDHPRHSNPDISGYESCMTAEALDELLDIFSPACHRKLAREIRNAIDYCNA